MEPKEGHHITSLKGIRGQLTAAVPNYIRSLRKYEPLWLGDIDAEIKAYHDLSKKGSKHIPTMSTAHNAQDMLRLLGFLDRVTNSRHGRIIELYARCGGMDVRRLAFLKLYMFLSDEKRGQLAEIVYLMSEGPFCRFKKLMFKLPRTRAEPFADILEQATRCQFDLYIRVLSTTDLPCMCETPEDEGPDTVDRSVTKQTPMPPDLEETGDEWYTLQQRIISLPGELRDMIEENLWEIAFRPGQIFPHRKQACDSMEGKAYNPSIPRLFLAMDRALYEWIRIRFWSENTLVIGYGDAESTMDFLDHVPIITATGNDLTDIESVHLPRVRLHIVLRFSSKDLPEAADHCREITRSDLEYRSPQTEFDILNFLDAYRWKARHVANRLSCLWSNKFGRISKLADLEELTLDFTEAFAPGNEFIGTRSARGWRAFAHEVPPVCYIRAPTNELARELYDIIGNK